jgi:hypothetical protein
MRLLLWKINRKIGTNKENLVAGGLGSRGRGGGGSLWRLQRRRLYGFAAAAALLSMYCFSLLSLIARLTDWQAS